MWLQYSDIFEAQGAKFPTTGNAPPKIQLCLYYYLAGFKQHCSKLGEVPALPGVVQAYVQVGTGRGAPR